MLNKVAFWLRTFTIMPVPLYAILIIWLANGGVILNALIILILIQVWFVVIWIFDLLLFITKGMD